LPPPLGVKGTDRRPLILAQPGVIAGEGPQVLFCRGA
jgi:hypothetical protein